jgi:CelD/BcsL family acetyltransferase involved in cellulose biosynthesis
VTAEIFQSIAALEALRVEWEALAIAVARPYALPAWLLAWWSFMRPRGARLRVVVVRERGRLVGIAPFYADGSRYALLGGELASSVEPLAVAGREREVADAVAGALAEAVPRPSTVELKLQGDAPDWAELLSSAWPGPSPWQRAAAPTAAPAVTFEGLDFDGWLAGKSTSFRRWTRQGRRKLESAGATFRLSDETTLEPDVRRLLELHHERQGRGTALHGAGLEQMLVSAGRELLPGGHFRLLCLDVDGRMAGAQLLIAAGGEVAGWNGGFDQSYAKLSPAMHILIEAVRDATERGEARLDLGPGDQAYKHRLADRDRELGSRVLVPHGRGYPLARAHVALRLAAPAVRSRLTAVLG